MEDLDDQVLPSVRTLAEEVVDTVLAKVRQRALPDELTPEQDASVSFALHVVRLMMTEKLSRGLQHEIASSVKEAIDVTAKSITRALGSSGARE